MIHPETYYQHVREAFGMTGGHAGYPAYEACDT